MRIGATVLLLLASVAPSTVEAAAYEEAAVKDGGTLTGVVRFTGPAPKLPPIAVNKNRETALHGAAYRGGDALVRFLHDRHANLNVKNRKDWSPLTIAEGVFLSAVIQRYPTTAELLRNLGAEPSPPDVNRMGLGR